MSPGLFRRSISALALLAASSTGLLAEQVEGLVSGVGEGDRVDIRLPDGVAVAPGDPVEILAEIPGLGLTAITTRWQVDSHAPGQATATPLEAPSGTPQVGYVARVETEAAQGGAAPNVRSAASEPVAPDAPVLEDVPISQEAEAFYRKGVELTASHTPADIASGVDHFRRAATMRHPGAMTELGAAFSFGRGIKRDDQMALDWQGNAARLGSARAMHRLGLIHMAGRGVPINENLASDWLHKAAAEGDADAMYLVAMLYEDGYADLTRSLPEMVRRLEEAAEAGSVEAMFILGHIYLDGEDGIIPKDVVKTDFYWTKAAEAGHVASMEELAEFWEGEALNTVARWEEAARAAPRPATWTEDPRCLSAWECYTPDRWGETSEPVPVPAPTPVPAPMPTTDPVEPSRPDRSPKVIYVVQDCDRLAASARDSDRPDLEMEIAYGDLDAPRVIAECLEDIEEWPDTRRFYAQIARGYHKSGLYAEAFEAASTGAQLGSSQAMAMVGLMYKTGQSVPADPFEALRWFEKGASAGNITAKHFAAGMHLHAQGVPYNPQAAVRWFEAASQEGSSGAFTSLGILQDRGEGTPPDPAQAAVNLLIALSTGSTDAKELLLQNPNSLTPQTRVEIQRFLRSEGLYTGALDGAFGPQTFRALEARIMN